MINKLLVATMVVATACAASAKTLYVDCNRANDDGPGTTEATAFRTIQAAVTNAANNDTIIVLPGVYAEGYGTDN